MSDRAPPIVTDEMVEAALKAWRPAIGLLPGQYLYVPRYDKAADGSVTDILIPFGDTMMAAMRDAIKAAIAPSLQDSEV